MPTRLVGQQSELAWSLLLKVLAERDEFYSRVRLTTPAELDALNKYVIVRNKLVAGLENGLQLTKVAPSHLPALLPPGFTP